MTDAANRNGDARNPAPVRIRKRGSSDVQLLMELDAEDLRSGFRPKEETVAARVRDVLRLSIGLQDPLSAAVCRAVLGAVKAAYLRGRDDLARELALPVGEEGLAYMDRTGGGAVRWPREARHARPREPARARTADPSAPGDRPGSP